MRIVDILPPIVASNLRVIRDRARGPITHIDALGRRVDHRGTSADIGVVHQVFYNRDYDLTRLKRHAEILRFYDGCKNPLIIDAGANIGASAVWFAQTFPRAVVSAVEPHAANFQLLLHNVRALKVRPVMGALAKEAGTVQLFDPGEGDWGFRTGDAEGLPLGNVQAYTLADLIEPDDDPFILKIDIEGGEADLFQVGDFQRFPVVIIELHDWLLPRAGTSKSFLKWHVSQDRDLVHHGENIFSLCNALLK